MFCHWGYKIWSSMLKNYSVNKFCESRTKFWGSTVNKNSFYLLFSHLFSRNFEGIPWLKGMKTVLFSKMKFRKYLLPVLNSHFVKDYSPNFQPWLYVYMSSIILLWKTLKCIELIRHCFFLPVAKLIFVQHRYTFESLLKKDILSLVVSPWKISQGITRHTYFPHRYFAHPC